MRHINDILRQPDIKKGHPGICGRKQSGPSADRLPRYSTRPNLFILRHRVERVIPRMDAALSR
jgi:hypothetical protein